MYRAHPMVCLMLEHYRRVSREGHRMLDLIRFVEMDSGILVSQFETDTYLLTILSSHFFNRLSNEQWMLHDVKRGLASICNGRSWEIIQISDCKP